MLIVQIRYRFVRPLNTREAETDRTDTEGTGASFCGLSTEVSKMASSDDVIHRRSLPGEHYHQGVLYTAASPQWLLEKLPTFEFGGGDVLLATYPKSGTTWLQEVLYLIYNGADVTEAATRPPGQRVPFLEMAPMWSRLATAPKPRLIKTHLRPSYFQHQLSEGQMKVVLVLRNPRDTLVSYYHFYKQMPDLGSFNGSWSDFFRLVEADKLVYGDWYEFTHAWWAQRHLENVHVLTYEAMKQDPRGHVTRLAAFCGQHLTDAQIDVIVQATSFSAMKAQPQHDFKLRKGATGDWQNYLTEPQLNYFKHREQKLCDVGLTFQTKEEPPTAVSAS